MYPTEPLLVLSTNIILFITNNIISVAVKEYFGDWMSAYDKHYDTQDEYRERLGIFAQNAEMVFRHNTGNNTYTSK